MTQVAICMVLLSAAVATFFLDGKQWPTFSVTLIFGIYLGHTSLGQWCMSMVNDLFAWASGLLS
ncbi:hypothetical protein ACWENQ_44825 [Nonomuraea sp. NPDC004354]